MPCKPASPQLQRICLSEDGRLKANFSDNSILVLNATGSGFVHLNPGPSSSHVSPAVTPSPVGHAASQPGSNPRSPNISRQLSEYALSRHLPQLRVALEFRNMHLDQPFFCQPLLRKHPRPQGLSLGFLITDLWWPCSAGEALAAGLVHRLPDGRTVVSTSDGSARIVLHHHRRRFAVCYPLLVQESPEEGQFHYVWHTQVFSMQDFPARWRPAVELLLDVVDQMEQEACTQGAAPAAPWQGDGVAADGGGSPELPPQQQHWGRHGWQQQQQTGGDRELLLSLWDPAPARPRCTRLPAATHRGLSGSTGTFEPGSWWLEPTLTLFPPNDVIVLEWTPSALYQLYPTSCEVEVWVSHDDSCLASIKQGRYLRHFRCAQGTTRVTDQLYAASAVPESVWAGPPSLSQPHAPSPGTPSLSHPHAPSLSQHHAPSPGTHSPQLQHSQDRPAAASGEALRDASQGAASLGGADAGGGADSAELPWRPSRYPLANLAAHALKLREQMRLLVAARASVLKANSPSSSRHSATAPSTAAGLEESFRAVSDKVIEHAEVPGQGTLTAYEDGRVRAIFTDRTIVHMNMAQSHCKVFLPDGACMLVAADNPVGIEPYVQAIAEFAAWAFKTMEERAQDVSMQALVEAELGAARRMATLLEAAVDSKAPRQVPLPAPLRSSPELRHPHRQAPGLAVLRPAPLEEGCMPQLGACPGAGCEAPQGLPEAALGGPFMASHDDGMAQGSSRPRANSDMQDMVNRLLQDNARLLERLG